jgi:hypothetical protein
MALIDKTNKFIFDVLFNNYDCIKFTRYMFCKHGIEIKTEFYLLWSTIFR